MSFYHEDVTFPNMYCPKIKVHKTNANGMKEKLKMQNYAQKLQHSYLNNVQSKQEDLQ